MNIVLLHPVLLVAADSEKESTHTHTLCQPFALGSRLEYLYLHAIYRNKLGLGGAYREANSGLKPATHEVRALGLQAHGSLPRGHIENSESLPRRFPANPP